MNAVRDLPDGPVVKNPPSNAGDVDSIPDLETKTPNAVEQVGSCTATRQAHVPKLEKAHT